MILTRPSYVVLGAGGFLGTNLCRRLISSGAHVRAFGRRGLFSQEVQGIEWYEGEFSNAATVAAAIATGDVVFHLIHGGTPKSAEVDTPGDIERNVVPSVTLLDICKKLGVQKIIYVSSGGTVYGRAKTIPTPETETAAPISAYGLSKLTIERYIDLYDQVYGLGSKILRVTNAFGPFQVPSKNQGIVGSLIARAFQNEKVEIWGDGSIVRDFIFVDDVVDALVAAVNDQSSTRVFNIGSGEGHSLRELIETIERLLNRKIKIEWKPGRPLDVPASVVDIGRAKDILGWTPKTPLELGLRKTINWWRTVKWTPSLGPRERVS